MRVTASNSSAQYRGTAKSPREIGRELGVDYLLVGKVRWQKSAGGASRVQVSPELIEVNHRRRQVAAAVRRRAHGRVPGAGRHRGQGGERARRGDRKPPAAGARGPSHPEPGRLRRLLEREGPARPGFQSRDLAAGRHLVRGDGGARLDLRRRVGRAVGGRVAVLCPGSALARGRRPLALRGRPGDRPRPEGPRRLSRPGGLLPPRRDQTPARRRVLHQGPRPRARGRRPPPGPRARRASPRASGSGRWSISGGARAWTPGRP